MSIKKITFSKVTDAEINDLKTRLANTRFIPNIPASDQWLGMDKEAVCDLLDYWRNNYDYRIWEEKFNSLPWYEVDLNGSRINFIHLFAGENKKTVVLLHGWPDSFLRYWKLIPLLKDYNVVIPALPGYPYSSESFIETRFEKMADAFKQMMDELGYEKYVVSAGDILNYWAYKYPEKISCLHIVDAPQQSI